MPFYAVCKRYRLVVFLYEFNDICHIKGVYEMKKRLPILISVAALVICAVLLLPKSANAAAGIPINKRYFPDAKFRDYILEKIDTNGDKYLSASEASAVKKIELDSSYAPIKTLIGIGNFKNLTFLSCNEIGLTSLDLSGNPALVTLYCWSNPELTSLELQNTEIWTLNLEGNGLKNLEISKCTKITYLNCCSNGLTSLDVSKNTALTFLALRYNQLKKLDLSNNHSIEVLDCSMNKLTSLTLSEDMALRTLSCDSNQLTQLNLDGCPGLMNLNCTQNKLSSLDLSQNLELEKLYVEFNPVTEIDISEAALGLKIREGLGETVFPGGAGGSIDVQIPGSVGYWEYTEPEPGDEDDGYKKFARFDKDDTVIALAKPSLKCVNNASAVKLSWAKIQGAAEYDVSRALKGSTDYQPLKTVAETSYTDKTAVPGTAYTYRICAKNGIICSRNADCSITRNPFKDVSENASYFTAVMWAVNNGITKGTSATTFSPNQDCTRYQFAVMLYKLAGKPAVSGTMPFTDVSSKDSYYKAVLWAYTNGIISGTSKKTFSPNAGVTRYQVVAMLYKFAGKPAVSGTLLFDDVAPNASYYNAVLWAVQNGITKGTDKKHFSPNTVCKRYQMVVFLYKYNNIYHLI